MSNKCPNCNCDHGSWYDDFAVYIAECPTSSGGKEYRVDGCHKLTIDQMFKNTDLGVQDALRSGIFGDGLDGCTFTTLEDAMRQAREQQTDDNDYLGTEMPIICILFDRPVITRPWKELHNLGIRIQGNHDLSLRRICN
jgi:hypothetical protein